MTHRKADREEELKFNLSIVIFFIIGFLASWGNMFLILEAPPNIEVIAYLSIILTTIIPGLIIALKNRLWGYGYLLGFSFAGIPFMFIIDLFIGGYTFITTLFIFAILWLIFWKAWRSLSSIKIED